MMIDFNIFFSVCVCDPLSISGCLECSTNQDGLVVCDTCEIGSPIEAYDYICECPDGFYKNSTSNCVGYTEETINNLTVELL